MPLGKSWISLVMLIGQAILQIITQENAHGPKQGPAKRELVLHAVENQAKKMNLATQPAGCAIEEILSYVGEIIDNVVGLGNCLGIFKHG